jgi:hypothetical protein
LQNLLAEMQTIYTHSGRAMMMIIWHMKGGDGGGCVLNYSLQK